ncbi:MULTISPECIES: ribosome silencing factor [Paenibacillus]|jgi:ribosome-associated protein|uniref:Ribosomal silencing factor RsfS n=2 Tax=Paenibacillus lactis TaxID=228574 RepID=G4HDY1_9BACL|nr:MULTISPECIES: ribosome silencing factor [Paenibacillus]EHB65050.1 iojap-like protein [Paenibacillus lactis 154]MBP1895103.1 ribosome-associated protein [Paenibacillus lactis]MCM3495660.1 ribosome silencing factor [Paenibacillus lactis]GIO90602.1 ribosomal silencing factor RsfS [Paenibacillus lactis]HAF99797.1 ribosome silencing factor [Paenibacillus lactis]
MTIKPEELLNIAVEAAEDKKANDLVVLDLRGISLVADYFVICHGNSDTQVQAIATEIRKRIHDKGVALRGLEGMDAARWVLMDIGDVVVHIFHRDEREYYNIERLWSDAKVVENV